MRKHIRDMCISLCVCEDCYMVGQALSGACDFPEDINTIRADDIMKAWDQNMVFKNTKYSIGFGSIPPTSIEDIVIPTGVNVARIPDPMQDDYDVWDAYLKAAKEYYEDLEYDDVFEDFLSWVEECRDYHSIDESYFSWSSCDICDSHLGGNRYDAYLVPDIND